MPLPGIYPKELKTEHFRDTCIAVYTAAQLTVANLWNQSRSPSIDKQIKKMYNIHTIEFYSSIKKE